MVPTHQPKPLCVGAAEGSAFSSCTLSFPYLQCGYTAQCPFRIIHLAILIHSWHVDLECKLSQPICEVSSLRNSLFRTIVGSMFGWSFLFIFYYFN